MKTPAGIRFGAAASLSFAFLGVVPCEALTLGGPFTDGAVLQRGKPVRVWGTAAAGETVEVAFGGKSAAATADAKGAWRCELPAFAASRESRELVARAPSGEVRVKDVVVGEVWIAAGQSNMEFPLWCDSVRLRDRQGALTAQMCEKPLIRCAGMRNRRFAATENAARKAVWRRFEPQMLLHYGVSAVGAYFALEIYHALEIPVGLIEASWGGTMIEPWIPHEGLAAVPALADLAAYRPKTKTVTTDVAYREGRDNQQPSVLWNEMLASIAPFQTRGAIWYQGESNRRNPTRYCDLLKGLYAGWSARFGNPDFRFYLVQIAPHNYGGDDRMCLVQEAMQRFADGERNAEIAIINDIGDLAEIHPHEKGTVGKRLAAFALANDYGFRAVKPRAPTPGAVTVSNDVLTVAFNDAGALYTYDEPLGFELAGADGKWCKASVVGFRGNRGGVFRDGKVSLAAKEVKDPRHVRYLWKWPWKGHLYSGSGVPVGVFRRDLPGTAGELVSEVADTYFVNPVSGDDAAAGTTIERPLRTIDGALARIRTLRAAGRLAGDRKVTIRLDETIHTLAKPVVLGPEDSNLTIAGGSRGGACVVRGGVELGPFAEERPGLWSCPVPKGLAFEQFYVNDRRCDRARTPNKGWFFMEGFPKSYVDPETGAVSSNRASVRVFRAYEKDAAALAGLSPEEIRDVEVHVWQSWSDAVARLQTYDPATRTCVTTPSARWAYSFWNWQGPKRYAFVNCRGALDAPGEWFLDRKAGKLYYMPREGERIDGVTAIAPVLESILEIRGDRAHGRPVRNVTIDGIRFEYAAYNLPANGRDDAQAAVNEPAAIRIDDAEDLYIGGCEFFHTGAHAAWLKEGVRRAKVYACRFGDLGGGGVYIGPTKWLASQPERVQTREVTVDDCVICGGGREMTGAIGIFLGGAASDCAITHNAISDLNYSGISCGWSWGYKPTATKRNKLNWNHIHDIGHGVMSDMAGIYTLGLSEGTEIVGNVIHDVVSYDKSGRGGWGIYTDEGSSGIRIASNLVYRLKTGPVHQNYGRDNLFENNIFAYGGDEQIKRSSPKGEPGTTNKCSFVFRKNIVLFGKDAPFAFARTLKISETGYLDDLFFDHNVWWREGGAIGTNAFECLSWEDWRAKGKDEGSVIADPLFADPAKGSFLLKGGSPAARVGFVPWDFSKAGLYPCRPYWISSWWKEFETGKR